MVKAHHEFVEAYETHDGVEMDSTETELCKCTWVQILNETGEEAMGKVAVYHRLANETTPKTAIYCRSASANDSVIKTQEKTLRNYATERRLSVGKVYFDNGASGSTLERPAFQEMMSAVERGEIDCIIVKNVCRISRNYVQFGKWLDDMRAKNVRVITSDGSFDSNSYPVQLTSFEEVMVKYYKESHSKKIKSGIAKS